MTSDERDPKEEDIDDNELRDLEDGEFDPRVVFIVDEGTRTILDQESELSDLLDGESILIDQRASDLNNWRDTDNSDISWTGRHNARHRELWDMRYELLREQNEDIEMVRGWIDSIVRRHKDYLKPMHVDNDRYVGCGPEGNRTYSHDDNLQKLWELDRAVEKEMPVALNELSDMDRRRLRLWIEDRQKEDDKILKKSASIKEIGYKHRESGEKRTVTADSSLNEMHDAYSDDLKDPQKRALCNWIDEMEQRERVYQEDFSVVISPVRPVRLDRERSISELKYWQGEHEKSGIFENRDVDLLKRWIFEKEADFQFYATERINSMPAADDRERYLKEQLLEYFTRVETTMQKEYREKADTKDQAKSAVKPVDKTKGAAGGKEKIKESKLLKKIRESKPKEKKREDRER
ncbi:MAG: hypothetical protein K2W95_14245 [Candidatus Obscuribacterales bacterium]|nr:hypothetical protein [Candidatus Obscuribacterales bacterium]